MYLFRWSNRRCGAGICWNVVTGQWSVGRGNGIVLRGWRSVHSSDDLCEWEWLRYHRKWHTDSTFDTPGRTYCTVYCVCYVALNRAADTTQSSWHDTEQLTPREQPTPHRTTDTTQSSWHHTKQPTPHSSWHNTVQLTPQRGVNTTPSSWHRTEQLAPNRTFRSHSTPYRAQRATDTPSEHTE